MESQFREIIRQRIVDALAACPVTLMRGNMPLSLVVVEIVADDVRPM